MNTEPDDISKKQIDPSIELPTEIPEPNVVQPVEGEEQDLDDLVHAIPIETPAENRELDPDEAVHQQASIIPADKLAEKDPDDLVHGNE